MTRPPLLVDPPPETVALARPMDSALRAALLLAAAGAVVRLVLVWTGACDAYVIADDAFYYFTIARNIALGHGATFDGLAPTNGFHPLYLLAITPLWWVARAVHAGPWGPVHLALSLCALCDVATGWLLFRLLARLGSPRAGVWAAGVWALSPWTVLITLRGLEGALSALLVVVTFHAAATAFAPGPGGVRRGAALGLAFGLAGLARTDNWPFLTYALTAMSGYAAARKPRAALLSVRPLAAFAAVAAACALPWFVWSARVVGTPWQVSGAAKFANPRIYGNLATRPLPLPTWLTHVLNVPLKPLRYLMGEEFTPLRWSYVAAGLALTIALMTVLGMRRRDTRWSPRAAPLALGAAVYLASHVVAYGLVFHSYTTWYAAVPALMVSAAIGVGIGNGLLARHSPGLRRSIGVGALALAAAGFLVFFAAQPIEPRGQESRVAPDLERLARDRPLVRTIGAYNAGAIGYFAPSHGGVRVVNLDCLVNNRAYEAWTRGRYYDYLVHSVDALWLTDPEELAIWLTPDEQRRVERAYPRWDMLEIYGPPRRVP